VSCPDTLSRQCPPYLASDRRVEEPHPSLIFNEAKVNNTSKTVRWIALTTALPAAVLSATAFAEYRCARPEQLANAEVRACALAQQDSPDALIRFVNRTKVIYGLYAGDYVSSADVERWEGVRRGDAEDSAAIAKAKSDTRDGDPLSAPGSSTGNP
jgi:hypothetical protein